MAITQRDRHHMFDALQRALGDEAAMTLADHLPASGWSAVATRNDVAATTDEIHSLKGDAGQLKTDVTELKTRLDARFDAAQRHTDVAVAELRAEMHAGFATLTRQMWTASLTSMLGMGGLALAAARLLAGS